MARNSFSIRITLLITGLMLGVIVSGALFLGSLDTAEKMAQVVLNEQYIKVQIARDTKDIARGLSYKKALGLNEGMIFLFKQPGYYGFWMKDMNFPIDIVWISGREVVGFLERVTNSSERFDNVEIPVYYPSKPVDKVLELAAGRVHLLQLRIGDVITIKPFAPQLVGKL